MICNHIKPCLIYLIWIMKLFLFFVTHFTSYGFNQKYYRMNRLMNFTM